MTRCGSRVCEEKGRRRGQCSRTTLIDFKVMSHTSVHVTIYSVGRIRFIPSLDLKSCVNEWVRSSTTNVGNVPRDSIRWLRGVLTSRHFAVDLDLCLDRYSQLRTLPKSAPSSLSLSLSLSLSFPPLPQFDPPVDTARANDTAMTFAWPRAKFKSELFFVS